MKSIIVFLILLSFPLFSQEAKRNFFPTKYSIGSAFQNEDIFLSAGAGYDINNWLSLELRYGVGMRRTFFQNTLFSKLDLVFNTDFLKSDFWSIGPSLKLSAMNLSPKVFRPIQKYASSEIGYCFAFGNKVNFYQSSYLGFRNTKFVGVSNKNFYIGYSFECGLIYEI